MESDGAASGYFSSANSRSWLMVSAFVSRSELTEGRGAMLEKAMHDCAIDTTAMRLLNVNENMLGK